MQDYENRLKLPITGKSDIILFTRSSYVVSTTGYNRIVIGKRGPYIEFDNIDEVVRYIPEDQKWRLKSNMAYYIEYRTNEDNVKIYHQLKTVDYADYVVGKYYISPFDLYTYDGVVIEKLKK